MNSNKNHVLTVIRVIVAIFLVATAGISFMHIVESGTALGLGVESWLAPMFIDGIAIVGKLSMSKRFSQSFRKSGLKLLMVGGVLSLAANIYAGHNLGQRAFGALVVVGFMLLESHAAKADRTAIAETPAPAGPRRLDPTVVAARTAKARATRERNRLAAMTPAQKRAETRARNAVAPVSPGRPPVATLDMSEFETATV